MLSGATEAGFFEGDRGARDIYREVKQVLSSLEGVTTKVQKSQIGFCREHPFAAVWRPKQYLSGERPPLVLSVFLRRRDQSPRWKEVTQSRPGRFSHHIELNAISDVDSEVREWLTEAWVEAAS
jgi:hypothetical protein